MNSTAVEEIPLKDLIAGDNDRVNFDPESLKELAESIRIHGLAQPITVRPLRQDGEDLGIWQVVAGERRSRAVRLLGWETIPAIVKDLDDSQASSVMLLENIQRADLTPIEQARAFKKRMDRFGWSVEEVAKVSQVKPQVVSKRLRLLTLCPEAQFLVEKGQIPLTMAELMSDLDFNRQIISLRLFQRERPPSLVEFRTYCSDLLEAQGQEAMFDITDYCLAQLEVTESGLPAEGAGVKTDESMKVPKMTRWLGVLLEDYAADLFNSGKLEAALAITTLYDSLVRARITKVPRARTLPAELLKEVAL